MKYDKQSTDIGYLSPDIEVLNICFEGGYSFSDPIRDEEEEWD